jgi:FOG: Ankyrin repeat
MTPLTKAAASGDVTAINTLLKEGKGVNEASKGKYYASPLHWAARYGHIEAVKLLLDAGANINGNDYCNQTPLIYAIYGNSNGGIEIAKVLIARGADTESLDCFGWKAINYAKQSNNNTITNLIESNNVLAKKTGIDDPDFMPDQYTIDLKGSIPKINFRSNKKITVVVYDKRSYVISGNTKPEYLGFIQNYTRPLTEMTTANKRPLAEVLANNIAYGFKDAGFEIAQIIYGYRDNDKFKIENFKQNKSEQIIVLTIKEWHICIRTLLILPHRRKRREWRK